METSRDHQNQLVPAVGLASVTSGRSRPRPDDFLTFPRIHTPCPRTGVITVLVVIFLPLHLPAAGSSCCSPPSEKQRHLQAAEDCWELLQGAPGQAKPSSLRHCCQGALKNRTCLSPPFFAKEKPQNSGFFTFSFYGKKARTHQFSILQVENAWGMRAGESASTSSSNNPLPSHLSHFKKLLSARSWKKKQRQVLIATGHLHFPENRRFKKSTQSNLLKTGLN